MNSYRAVDYDSPNDNFSFSENIDFNKPDPNILIDPSEVTFVRPLGKGGYGNVDLCLYKGEIEVAIKRLQIPSKENINGLLKEAEKMRSIRHSNIVFLYGVIEKIDSRYSESIYEYQLVMEYMPRGSLLDFLKKEEVTWEEKWNIAIDVATAIDFLHSHEKIHCDLKPDNVLINNAKRAKLADFGTLCEKTANSTFGPRQGGTYHYMPPEMCALNEKNEEAHPTKEADVYSFGLILWALASHDLPFKEFKEQKQIPALARKIADGAQETITPDTPSRLRKLIKKCWKQPDKRPTMRYALFFLHRNQTSIYRQLSSPYENEKITEERDQFDPHPGALFLPHSNTSEKAKSAEQTSFIDNLNNTHLSTDEKIAEENNQSNPSQEDPSTDEPRENHISPWVKYGFILSVLGSFIGIGGMICQNYSAFRFFPASNAEVVKAQLQIAANLVGIGTNLLKDSETSQTLINTFLK